jgi:uncharacterized protein YidB (DUF937 family)
MAGLEDLLGGLLGGGQGGSGAQAGTPDLGAMLGQLTGGEGGLDMGKLAALAGPLLATIQQSGGLDKILGQLQSGGLGDAVSSWLGTGANQAVDPSALGNAFGSDQVANLANQAGISVDDVQQGLSNLLPGLVDKISPNGQLPDASSLNDLMGQLGGLLGGLK